MLQASLLVAGVDVYEFPEDTMDVSDGLNQCPIAHYPEKTTSVLASSQPGFLALHPDPPLLSLSSLSFRYPVQSDAHNDP